jgi:ATP/maltotriose-dependent transcriptional regulator MalT
VVGPVEYGKTTLLSQWAKGNGQAFAWVSVDGGQRREGPAPLRRGSA